MKKFLLILILFSYQTSVYSNEFKKERTYYYSPLSYTINHLENIKKYKKTITPQSIKTKIQKIENFNKTNSKNNNWKFKINHFNGTISLITGDVTSKKYSGSIENASKQFLEENKELLNIDPNSLKKISETNFLGTSHIYYIQTYRGLDVEFSHIKIHRNKKDEITQYNSRYYKDIHIDTNPSIQLDYAIFKIKQDIEEFKVLNSTMVIYPDELNNKFHLAYKIEGYGGKGVKNGNWIYYINANDGNILFKYDKRQYSCLTAEETTGTIKAFVYEISPIPIGDPNGNWLSPILTPISDLNVFVYNYQNLTTTKSDGEYCYDYGTTGAKIFFTTLGPYFSVVDYNGNNLFYTNANYQVRSTSLNSTLSINSYSPNTKIIRTLNPTLTINPGETLAFITPYFSSLNIGNIDEFGNSTDGDYVYITQPNEDRISAFVGSGKSNFVAGWIPSNSYTIGLISDESGTGNFSITASTYIVLTNPTGNNNSTGSFNIPASPLINTFYHLNKVRNFFMKFNSKCSPYCIDLNKRVPVNVNVYAGTEPMYNAFYDLRQDAIYLGRGPTTGDKNFAWDGTVIRHEYVHLIMNRIYPIIYFGEFGAITEALADYFALSSFWDEGKNITILGNFLGTGGEGASRDISSISKKMPNDWKGQVHDDGQILSGVFYKLAKGISTYNLGTFTTGVFAGLNKSDLYIFGAMFYFPDSFEAFMEAMVDLCKRIQDTYNYLCEEQKIRNAFSAHGIISDYIIVDQYEPNNGPSYAVDITTFQSVKAYIDYPGDEDYYMLSAGEGFLHLKLQLPQHYSGFYHAYTLFLFDVYGNPLAYQMPPTRSSLCYPPGDPQYSGNCLTRNSENEFYFYISTPGIYYVLVTAGLNNDYGGPGVDYNRVNSYLLSYDSKINTSLKIDKKLAKVDEDEFEFSITIPKFYYNKALSNNWQDGQIFEFCEKDCIEIFDNRMIQLSKDFLEVTDINGSSGSSANYYSTDLQGNNIIKGKIKFKQDNLGRTFSQRYPYVGTIYFKIKAKNHMFEIGNKNDNYITLGLSNPISLTGSLNDIISYNNIIDKNNHEIIIKVETKDTSNITINVYTPTGTLVKKIYSGTISGKMSFVWSGDDENGKKLPSGIYYIKTEGAINKIEKVGIVR